MVMKYEAECPHCKETLEEDDCIDTYGIGSDTDSTSRIGHCMIGHCPCCEREFTWVEVYEYVGVQDLQEEE